MQVFEVEVKEILPILGARDWLDDRHAVFLSTRQAFDARVGQAAKAQSLGFDPAKQKAELMIGHPKRGGPRRACDVP
jgi:hypothetical protein